MLGLCDAGFLDQEMLVPEVTLVLATAKKSISIVFNKPKLVFFKTSQYTVKKTTISDCRLVNLVSGNTLLE